MHEAQWRCASDGLRRPVRRTALVTGIGGQDGSYLVELLLHNQYDVHGVDNDRQALDALRRRIPEGQGDRVGLHYGDVTDFAAVLDLLVSVQPGEIYNLAAQTRVDLSFTQATSTAAGIVLGTSNLLEAVRTSGLQCRVFQASSSEMFGNSEPPQAESTAFDPLSPYARAKVDAHRLVRRYREDYGLHVSAGILFNHESPRRSRDFVSRRITSGIAEILSGERDGLPLGNLTARRDWGHAADYVRAMWLMLQRDDPADFVIASERSHSVADLASQAFSYAGLDWRNFVSTNAARFRPSDPRHLRGDATRAHEQLGWFTETSFETLLREMVIHDVQAKGLSVALYSS